MNDKEYDGVLDVEGFITELADAYAELDETKQLALSSLGDLYSVGCKKVVGVVDAFGGLDNENNCREAVRLLREARMESH